MNKEINVQEGNSYVQMILNIKLWEWEGVREQMNMSMMKDGPSEWNVNPYEVAVARIAEIKEALLILNTTNK